MRVCLNFSYEGFRINESKLARNTLFLPQLKELHIELKPSFELFDGCQRKLSKWLTVELAPTVRTNRLRLLCKPTKRLRDLLAATEALCLDGNSRRSLAHKKPSLTMRESADKSGVSLRCL